jgi:hypothetical protein
MENKPMAQIVNEAVEQYLLNKRKLYQQTKENTYD